MGIVKGRKIRFGILASHPIQYQAPLFRRLATQPDLALEVLFCHDHGVKPSYDPGFGRTIQFDVPLTEGYPHRFLKNVARRPSVGFYGKVNPEIPTLLRSGQYDAFLIHGYAAVSNLIALGTPRPSRTRLMMRGESHLYENRSRITLAAKSILLPALLGRVDHFLAIGTWNAAYYRRYGVPEDRITLAPYSVDGGFFSSAAHAARADRNATRTAFGVSTEAPVFLYCSKLTPRKRPFDAIRAFAAARRQAPCELVLVGDGPLAGEVDAEVHRLGLASSIHRLGFRNQSELPSIYAMADAFILPSEAEPWGLVVNEAMACGLAVVVTDGVGAGPDLVKGVGEVYPCGDVDALASILGRWVQDPNTLQMHRAASKERIASWGLAETVEGVMQGLEKALSRH